MTIQPPSDILANTERYIRSYYAEHMPQHLDFHNISHVLSVYKAALRLGVEAGLDARDTDTLGVAALWHDIGYEQGALGHEERSAQKMGDWLDEHGWAQDRIQEAQAAVLDTRIDQQPQTPLGQLLSDADLHHMGTKEYAKQCALLRNELALTKDIQFSDLQWAQKNVGFFSGHHFKTQAGETLYGPRKKKNLEKLNKQIAKYLAAQPGDSDLWNPLNADKLKGVQTMFRTALRNHNSLSRIADNKASIMISITAIMISVVFSALAPKLDTNPHLVWPAILFIGICIATMIFSILSARPNVTRIRFDQRAFDENKYNILFFGNFADMTVEQFDESMKVLMSDPEKLYSSLIRDLYYLGKVQVQKYKYLRYAYNIFMYGLILAALAFVVVLLSYNAPDAQPTLLNNL